MTRTWPGSDTVTETRMTLNEKDSGSDSDSEGDPGSHGQPEPNSECSTIITEINGHRDLNSAQAY